MTAAVTEKFEELVLEAEDLDNSGVYIKLCGLVDVTITRAATVDTDEIPDCSDESLPLSVERQVRSIDVTISGTGVWAQQSHGYLMDWFYSSATREIRVQNAKASVGDTEYESGPALITKLESGRTKGKKVTASLDIQFDGTPTRTAAAT
jgi:Phage tail tube protein